jgi:cytochrome b pre-mRNA-processing protein 3
MRRLGEAFYGRGKALDAAMMALPDTTPLSEFLARSVFGGAEDADPAPLGDYLMTAQAALEATGPEALLAGDIDWPTVG